MKELIPLKGPKGPLFERELAPQFKALLRGLVGKVPFLKFESLTESPRGPDWTLKVRAGSRLWTVCVEAKSIAHPRRVREATFQLRNYLSTLPDTVDRYGVIVAPFISGDSARICEEAGLGYADLAGNSRISFDNVYIETRAPDNPFRKRKEVKSLFAPKACRVLKVLLEGPLRAWKTVELANASGVSTGWVSAVRQQLVAQEWAVSGSDGFRVSNPNAVLDAWVSADQWDTRTQVRQFSSLLTDPGEIARICGDAFRRERYAFTQWFAGWLRHPYTVPEIVTVYVDVFPSEPKRFEKQLVARRVEQGGRLWLVVPNDPGVFLKSQTVQGFNVVSDIQIYLDLHAGGRRGDEQAAELRKWPDFAGGWNL